MRRRGQLVVLAAALVAVALVPVVAAYLQLGYQPVVDRGAADPTASAERALSDGLRAATEDVPAANWSERQNASLAVRRGLEPTLSGIRDASPPGTATRVRFNDTAARRVAEADCPTGPNRAFGDCDAIRGVVVQSRENRTHVVAVAVDVTRTGADGRVEATLVVRR